MKKEFFKFLSIIFGLTFLLISCGEKDLYQGEDDDDDDDDEPIELAQRPEDLKFISYTISSEHNDNIYGTVSFPVGSDAMVEEIKYYETDLTKLKAAFKTNAINVFVGTVEQKSGITANNFKNTITYRLYTPAGEYRDFTVSLTNSTFSGIPVVSISTDDGKAVSSRDDWASASIVIDGQQEAYEEYRGPIEIKGRGHNSWASSKKAYSVKLASKDPVLNMNKHKRWVLIPSYGDKTILRNKIAYEIAKRTGLAWTPDSRFVQLVMNGKYQGTYLLCEHIRVDKNRVNITEMDLTATTGDAITGGYLFEIDRYYDEEKKDKKFRPTKSDFPVMIKSPDGDDINDAQFNYIKDYFEQVEAVLLNANFPGDGGYKDFLDINSFADWWIVHELTHNTEPNHPGSCYMHKDKLGKLCAGPVWDFDLNTFKQSNDFKLMNTALWYPVLFKDPIFKAVVKERWMLYRDKFATIPAYIDEQATYLEKSADINWTLYTLDGSHNQDEHLPWKEAVEKMKTSYTYRLNWMDGQIQAW